MKNQLGPWSRSNVQANEDKAPMLIDSLTIPFVTGSGARTSGITTSISKPIAQGSVSYHIEKDGIIVQTAQMVSGQQYRTIDLPDLTFPIDTRFRLLISTSPDLSPAGLDTIAWLLTPA